MEAYLLTAVPVVCVFILIGYVLVVLLLFDVTAALWQVQESSDVIVCLGGFCPMSRWPLLSCAMGIVWVVKGFFLARAKEGQ